MREISAFRIQFHLLGKLAFLAALVLPFLFLAIFCYVVFLHLLQYLCLNGVYLDGCKRSRLRVEMQTVPCCSLVFTCSYLQNLHVCCIYI